MLAAGFQDSPEFVRGNRDDVDFSDTPSLQAAGWVVLNPLGIMTKPDTISDKGTWSLDGETLRLESDKDITWKSKRVERRHLVVRRRRRDNELFLVGIDMDLAYFERKARDDPEFMFLLCSLKREKTIKRGGGRVSSKEIDEGEVAARLLSLININPFNEINRTSTAKQARPDLSRAECYRFG